MNCLIGFRNSERMWLMKVLRQSLGENPEQGSQDTSKSSHEFPMVPQWNWVRAKHSAHTHFPKDPNCDICLKTKITRASCRRRVGTVVPREEHFGALITADHKVLSEESDSRDNHRYAVEVQDLATQTRDPEEPNEVPGDDEETKSHLHWQFLRIWQVFRGIILESLYVNTTQIRNKWDCRRSSAQSERWDFCGAIAVRSG